MGEVDVDFIPQPQERPNPSLIQDDQNIPLIDLSCPDVAGDIGRACKQWGFFQIINHGVPTELRRKMEEVQREFFNLSMEEKVKVRRGNEKMGYYDHDYTLEIRDWKEAFDFMVQLPTLAHPDHHPVDHSKNQWPQSPPEMREVCQEYAKGMVELAMRLLGLIGKSLGLPERRFEEFFKEQASSVRMFRYPPCPSPELVLGVNAHKDPGPLAILAQDHVGGLQVKRKSDGQWVRVTYTPNAYIINIGDVLQAWTNGEYESVEHRVMVNPEKERYSTAFFLYPSHNTTVEPLEELISDQNPAKYTPFNLANYLLARKSSQFKKLYA